MISMRAPLMMWFRGDIADSDDIIRGGTGNDWLNGGKGVDQLYGDAGSDTADFSGSDHQAQVNSSFTAVIDDGFGNAETMTGIEFISGASIVI